MTTDFCPHCGSINYATDHTADGLSYWVRCVDCGATGPATASAHHAFAKWCERHNGNGREKPKPQRGSYERKRDNLLKM